MDQEISEKFDSLTQLIKDGFDNENRRLDEVDAKTTSIKLRLMEIQRETENIINTQEKNKDKKKMSLMQ